MRWLDDIFYLFRKKKVVQEVFDLIKRIRDRMVAGEYYVNLSEYHVFVEEETPRYRVIVKWCQFKVSMEVYRNTFHGSDLEYYRYYDTDTGEFKNYDGLHDLKGQFEELVLLYKLGTFYQMPT